MFFIHICPGRAFTIPHYTPTLGHGKDVDGVNNPDLALLARLQSSVSSTLSSGNGVAKGGIGGGQSDSRVQVLLGSDSAGTVAIALGSSAVAIEKSVTGNDTVFVESHTRSCTAQRHENKKKGGLQSQHW